VAQIAREVTGLIPVTSRVGLWDNRRGFGPSVNQRIRLMASSVALPFPYSFSSSSATCEPCAKPTGESEAHIYLEMQTVKGKGK
jgi:hypothetical protein